MQHLSKNGFLKNKRAHFLKKVARMLLLLEADQVRFLYDERVDLFAVHCKLDDKLHYAHTFNEAYEFYRCTLGTRHHYEANNIFQLEENESFESFIEDSLTRF